ncbi:MAG: ABC transporter permease [Dehalococcoidales bacterium]|jgi:putative ABC transport system permease protein
MTKSYKVAGLLAYTSIRKGNPGVILLTILILALVSLNLLFIPGLLQGLVSGANTQLINTYSSDIVVQSDTVNPLLNGAPNLVNKIEAINGVTAAAPRNSQGAEFIYGSEHTDAMVYGIAPETDADVFTIDKSIVEGSYLSPGDTDEIMLGIQLAGADKPDLELYARSLLTVHAGDEITVIYGNGVQKQYKVKGIFYTHFLQTDAQAFVSQTEMQSVYPATANSADSIYVKVKNDADINGIITQIGNIESGLKVLSWQDYAGIVKSLTDSFNVINVILNIVNLLIAGITVFIVTYIDVANRRRQIGVQRAIGITPWSISLSYLMRAIFYAITAIALAILLFLFVVSPLEVKYPFYFPFGAVYLVIGAPTVFRMTAIVLGISLVASFLPVRGMMRMKIMEAIWG